MEQKLFSRLLLRPAFNGLISYGFLMCLFFTNPYIAAGQEKNVDGQNYKLYKPGYFKPKRGLNYSLYVAPLLTVDPLGISGKSTYALTAGSQFRLWESKAKENALRGLQVKGWYV